MISRATMLIVALIASSGLPFGAQIGSSQSCNGAAVGYSSPAGNATGVGRSPARAQSNLLDRENEVIGLSVPDCGTCPNELQCNSRETKHFDNYVEGTPTWDPVLKLWTVSASWDGCYVEQTCYGC